MNEISFLQILYKNRVRLLAVSLAVGAVVGAVSLLFSNRYGATAAITIQRPEVPITGELSPLQVEALRSLTESTRIKRRLFDKMRSEGRLEERIDFRRFQRMLSTQVQYVEGRERTLLPMIRLTATATDPAISAEIANRWAEVVLDQTAAIYQSGVDELGAFTAGMYEEVNRSLLESEDRFAEIKLAANLEGNKLALKHNREVYSRLMKEVLDLEDRAATGEGTLRQMAARLAEQEVDGIWIGELLFRDEGIAEAGELPVSTPLTERIIRTIRSLARNEEALAEFEKTSGIDHKHTQVKVMKLQIEEISQEIMQARAELSSMEPTYEKYSEELETISPIVTLKKELSDEALRALLERKGKIEDIPGLESQISNPIYEEIKAEALRVSAQVAGLTNKIEQGGRRLEELRSGVTDLSREISSLAPRRRVLYNAVTRDRELLDYYALSYREDRRDYEKLRKDLEQGVAELSAKRASLEDLADRISVLEEEIAAGENAVVRRQRDVDNLSNIRDSLASRTQEVALLRVSMENVSRSGTVLLYGAEEDPLKVSPHRARIVLIAFLLGFLLYSMILILREVIARTDPEKTAVAA